MRLGDAQFRGEKYRHLAVYDRAELVEVLETLFRQSRNLELAVFSGSTDVVERQLASILKTLHALVASLPSLSPEVLKPILQALAATDALPQGSLPPSARAMEAVLLGFVCLASAELQVVCLPC